MTAREGKIVETKVIVWNESAAKTVAIYGARETGYYWRVKSGRICADLTGDFNIILDSHTGSAVSHKVIWRIVALAPHIVDLAGFFTKAGDDLRITTADGASGWFILEKIKGTPPVVVKSTP